MVLVLASRGDSDLGKAGPGPKVERPAASGEARHELLGFGALPAVATSDAHVAVFATAATYADVVMIQRAPPWQDFLPGSSVSRGTNESTQLETALLRQYASQLQLFYAIDPTDPAVERTRIADLPAGVDSALGFNDANLRNAFLAYTAYVAKNYNPQYLAIGVEINMLFERSPAQFEAFVELYRDAYDVAKGANASIKVFPTFQLEVLLGSYGTAHQPRWEVIDPFRTKMDVLAVSTYPFLGDARSAAEIPPGYFSQLRQRYSGEIIISETGYASAPVEGRMNTGTEEDQLAYLRRLLGEAETNQFALVVWVAPFDPAVARGVGASALRDVGLRRSDGSNKLAWDAWEEWARRPFAAP